MDVKQCSQIWCGYARPWQDKQLPSNGFHICNRDMTMYAWLRVLLEEKEKPVEWKKDDKDGSWHTSVAFGDPTDIHKLTVHPLGIIAVAGPHLKGMIFPQFEPLFVYVFKRLLTKLAKSGKCAAAADLFVKLDELKHWHAPDTVKLKKEDEDDQHLIMVFGSVADCVYTKRDDGEVDARILTSQGLEAIHFKPGDHLNFRNSGWVFFVRAVFGNLLDLIGIMKE